MTKSRVFGVLVLFVAPWLPAQENIRSMVESFIQGDTEIYTTANHPKASGLDIQLRYPSHLTPQEGVRPHIVQSFVGPLDTAQLMAVISIKPLPKELMEFSDAEIGTWLLDPETVTEQLPGESDLIYATSTEYDGEPGLLFSYVSVQSRAGVDIVRLAYSHRILFMRNLIDLTISYSVPMVGDPQPLEQAESDSLLTLSLLMGNSIVLMDKY